MLAISLMCIACQDKSKVGPMTSGKFSMCHWDDQNKDNSPGRDKNLNGLHRTRLGSSAQRGRAARQPAWSCSES